MDGMRWHEHNTARLSSPSRRTFRFSSTCHKLRRAWGSKPEVGSSSSTNWTQRHSRFVGEQHSAAALPPRTLGSPINAMATDNRRFWPPLSVTDMALVLSTRSSSLIISRTCACSWASGKPLMPPYLLPHQHCQSSATSTQTHTRATTNRYRCSATVSLSKSTSC